MSRAKLTPEEKAARTLARKADGTKRYVTIEGPDAKSLGDYGATALDCAVYSAHGTHKPVDECSVDASTEFELEFEAFEERFIASARSRRYYLAKARETAVRLGGDSGAAIPVTIPGTYEIPDPRAGERTGRILATIDESGLVTIAPEIARAIASLQAAAREAKDQAREARAASKAAKDSKARKAGQKGRKAA